MSEQVFAIQMVMVMRSDLPDIVERPCDNCFFKEGCPFSEFLIVDCPMVDKKPTEEDQAMIFVPQEGRQVKRRDY
ncbi:hypothetical protein J7J18_06485 [bacterium]|nr:hypothetical protein [bacterium]